MLMPHQLAAVTIDIVNIVPAAAFVVDVIDLEV